MELFFIIGLRWCSQYTGQASANLRHGLKRFERKILGVSAAAHKNLPTTVSAAHASWSAGEKERGREEGATKGEFLHVEIRKTFFFLLLYFLMHCAVFLHIYKKKIGDKHFFKSQMQS